MIPGRKRRNCAPSHPAKSSGKRVFVRELTRPVRVAEPRALGSRGAAEACVYNDFPLIQLATPLAE
jgi:hypothetical protein